MNCSGPRLPLYFVISGAICVLGCGTTGGVTSDGGGAELGAAGELGATSDGGAADLLSGDLTPTSCTRDPHDPDGGTCVLEVLATVVDDQGAPVPDLLTTVCEAQCYYGRTDAQGRTVVAVAAYIPAERYSLVIHGRPTYAGYYALLPPVVGGVARFAAPLVVLALPATGPAVAVDGTAQTLVSGDVTLDVPAGVKVDPDLEDTIDPDGVRFRSLRVPEAAWPAFVSPDAAGKPAALFAVSPYESDLSGPAQITFANLDTAALPAGAAVEVLGLGSLLWAKGPQAGTFQPIATAHVSSDGTRVVLDAGQGLTFLTWMGLRRKTP